MQCGRLIFKQITFNLKFSRSGPLPAIHISQALQLASALAQIIIVTGGNDGETSKPQD